MRTHLVSYITLLQSVNVLKDKRVTLVWSSFHNESTFTSSFQGADRQQKVFYETDDAIAVNFLSRRVGSLHLFLHYLGCI